MAPGSGGAAGGALRCATGSMLVELMVATVCAGLLAAGVLTLVVDSARTFRARHRAVEAVSKVEAAADALMAALGAAGAGLEGARAVSLAGERIDAVEVSADGLRVVIAAGAAREAEPASAGELRLEDVAALEPGDPVAGLGLVDPISGVAPEAVPVGRIAVVRRDRPRGPSGGTVGVVWAAPEAELLSRFGEPRALLPVMVRELGVRSLADGLQLRRRDLGGRWQPVVDALAEVELRALPGGVVQVRVDATLPDAPSRTTMRRIRVR